MPKLLECSITWLSFQIRFAFVAAAFLFKHPKSETWGEEDILTSQQNLRRLYYLLQDPSKRYKHVWNYLSHPRNQRNNYYRAEWSTIRDFSSRLCSAKGFLSGQRNTNSFLVVAGIFANSLLKNMPK